jgi:hypothetical protein
MRKLLIALLTATALTVARLPRVQPHALRRAVQRRLRRRRLARTHDGREHRLRPGLARHAPRDPRRLAAVPGHRANLLRRAFRFHGLAVRSATLPGVGTVRLWVHAFGR